LFFIPIPNLKSRIERDSASWNLEEEEIQRRRNIFWEFFFWDCWAVSALQHVLVLFRTLGYCRAYYMGVLLFWISRTRIVDFPEILTRTRCRLASRSLAVSCLFLRPTFLLVSDFSRSSVHSWKAHYSAACLSVAVQRTSSVHRMSYSSLLELDERIRSFPLPSYLHSPMHGGRDWDATPSRALQQFFAGNQRESSESLLPVYSAVFG
jgi:hypothetical protein